MAETFDAVIIGGGHNGLTCAAYLARAGLKVCVLERRSVIGGAAVTEEVWPGYRVSVASYVMSWLNPRIIRELELARHGYQVLPANALFNPLANGDHIFFYDDLKKTCAEIARFSPKDAEIYPAFDRELQDAARIVRELFWVTPPNPVGRRWKDIKETAQLLWRFRKIGGRLFRFADLLTQSVGDYLDGWFESDAIKTVLAYYAGIGTFVGPRSPGSAYVLLHHMLGEHSGAGGWGFVRGGMGAISNAIAGAAREKGAVIRTDAAISGVIVEGGRAVGVRLVNGEEVRGRVVASNADAKTTFLKLVDRRHLPDEFVTDIGRYRTFSAAFKINLAMEEPPRYTAFDAKRAGFDYPTYVHIAPSMEYLERAYDDAKYGGFSRRPFMTPVVPSIVDDSLAPKGKYVVNLFGGHAPYELKGTNWEAERDRLFDTVIDTLAEYAPNVKDAIIHKQVLTPVDLEAKFGLPQGHIFHGELALDQIFMMRPVPGYADYRSPVPGLYQCGSSTHPGGGVSGLPGHNAAREILRDLGR
ncbi:MAG: NAD(P)/FAD-dependent oxidoreductase [Alphaproteobacteria bacterium]|nr:NAD(P)/FAD-dependent oxidoreductase [Alphaproteobacteria bacterium]